MSQAISKQASKNTTVTNSEKPIVSFACGSTYTLINETRIHAHPVNKYYPSEVHPYLMARAKGGVTDFLYKVIAYIEINPLDEKKVASLPAKYDSIKKYIARRTPKFGFSRAPMPYRFYMLEPVYRFNPVFKIIKNNEQPKYYTFEEVGLTIADIIVIPDNEQEQIEQAALLSIEQLKNIAEKRGNNNPERKEVITKQYKRDPYISELAKRQANGICQLCKKQAPFITAEGQPYLETHHIHWLSEGGTDTIENTVAVCPNCHKRLHILNDAKDVVCLISLKQGTIR